MYVCVCRGVTDTHIKQEVCKGASTMRDLCKRLGVAATCGKCGNHCKQLLKTTLISQEEQQKSNQ